MEILWTILTSVHTKYGPLGDLLAFVLVGLGVILYEISKSMCAKLVPLSFDWSGLPYIGRFFKVKKKTPATCPLKKHPVFDKYKEILEYRIPHMPINCPLRKYVFTKLMDARIGNTRDQLLALVAMPRLNTALDSDISRELRSMFYKLSHDWHKQALAEGVPTVAIEAFDAAYSKYKDWNESMVTDLWSAGRFVYEDNAAKLVAIMDVMACVEEYTFVALEKVLNKLNGELSKATVVTTDGAILRCNHCDPACPNQSTGKAMLDDTLEQTRKFSLPELEVIRGEIDRTIDNVTRHNIQTPPIIADH